MTNTRDKLSGGGGDVAPSPRSPASSEDGKKTQKTVSVPIENCLTVGVQSTRLCTGCVQEGEFEGPENGPKQRRINNRLLSYRPQHRGGTTHNSLIVRWFSVFRNCGKSLVWYKTATSPPGALQKVCESPLRRSRKLCLPGSAKMYLSREVQCSSPFPIKKEEAQGRSLENGLIKRGALPLGNW